MLWNMLLVGFLTHVLFRVWLLPIWRHIFQETGKLGQKLEWYDTSFKQLSPKTRGLMAVRIIAICLLSLLFYLCFRHENWFPHFSWLMAQDQGSKVIVQYFLNQPWAFLKHLGLITMILWLLLTLEGRSRLILRSLQKLQAVRRGRAYLKPLSQMPYDPSTKELNLALFTAFSQENCFSLKQTQDEKWFKFSEKGQKGNTMVIGPTGGGKTMAVVLPLLEQTVAWQSQDDNLKASLVVYDPKAELTSIVAEVARKGGRSRDLIVFSLNGNLRVNPIKIDNPWDGETSWKVAGWIVGAWQNYQGKSSPEPYWESQNYILTRNLLVLEYFEKDTDVTLRHIAEAINEAASGCFRFTSSGKFITTLGSRVLAVFAAIDKDRYLKNYAKMEFDDIDRSAITQDIRVRTSERYGMEKGRFAKEREDFHLENDDKIQGLKLVCASGNGASVDQEIAKRLGELVQKDVLERFGEANLTEHDFMHTIILQRGEAMAQSFLAKHEGSKRLNQYLSIVEQACRWLIESWSANASDNRGSIVSNMQPFIQQFQTPELAYIFSPSREDETLSFDATITEGKILVPDFPGIRIGNGLAQGIITLIKSRWQHSVLALGSSTPRLKIQIMDEAQRLMNFGDGQKAIGDFDYCELSRSFGGITWFLSQSIASLEAKASREVEWKKVHGVVRSIICLSTNDTSTIKFMQDIAGKEIKKRTSQTVSETANSPGLDMISEKYAGSSDSLAISYTVSESLEERLQTSDVQDADAYTGIASIFDGRKNNLCRIALRPTFWPDRHDRYELIQKAEFDPNRRARFKTRIAKDPIKAWFQTHGEQNGPEII